MSSNLTTTEIDNTITSALSGYVAQTYVDVQDELNATQFYIQQQDNLRLKLAQKDVANGVPSLDSTGRINPVRVGGSVSQRYPRGFWSPTAYNASSVLVSTNSDTEVYTCGVTDPGYTYKLLVFGTFDGLSSTDGIAPVVSVRVGDTTGPIIAQGRGSLDSYNYWAWDNFNRIVFSGLGGSDYWEETYTGTAPGTIYVDGNQTRWNASGSSTDRQGFFRKTGPSATTYDDWQEITLRMSHAPEDTTDLGGRCRLYLYGRVNSSHSQHVYCYWDGRDTLHYGYSTAGSEVEISTHSLSMSEGDTLRLRCGADAGNKRLFEFLKNTTSLATWDDSSSSVTQMGANNRGWGWGIRPGGKDFLLALWAQTEPPGIDWITINDTIPGTDASSYAPVNVQPLNLASQSSWTGSKTLTVTVNRSANSSAVALTTARPNLHVIAVPV